MSPSIIFNFLSAHEVFPQSAAPLAFLTPLPCPQSTTMPPHCTQTTTMPPPCTQSTTMPPPAPWVPQDHLTGQTPLLHSCIGLGLRKCVPSPSTLSVFQVHPFIILTLREGHICWVKTMWDPVLETSWSQWWSGDQQIWTMLRGRATGKTLGMIRWGLGLWAFLLNSVMFICNNCIFILCSFPPSTMYQSHITCLVTDWE